MTAMLFTVPRQRVLDTNANPAAGARAYFYRTGTTEDLTVYQDRSRSIPHAQPVLADSSGWLPPIYPPDGSYKLQLKDALDVDLWPAVDDQAGPIEGGTSAGGGTTGSGDIAARIVPVGAIFLYATNAIPAGWLECNGAAISRTAYAELFAKWGVIYGAGDGSTTFNLLDMRGRFARGYDHGAGVDSGAASRTNRGDGLTGDLVGTRQGDAVGPLGLSATSTTSVTTTLTNATHAVIAGSANTSAGSGTFNISGASTTTASSSASTSTSVASSTSGAETTVKNVALVYCVLASAVEAAAGALGTQGLQYRFDAATANADPGGGWIRFNSTTYASATAIYINKVDAASANNGPFIGTWGDSSTVTNRGVIAVSKIGALGTNAYYRITGPVVDHVSYTEVPVAYVSASGSFSTNDNLSVQFSRTGDRGTGRDAGVLWTFSISTTIADPGTGKILFNNAALGSVTRLCVSAATGDPGNPSVSELVRQWGASTSAVRGRLIVFNTAAGNDNFLAVKIIGAIVDHTTWFEVPVTVESQAGSFSSGTSAIVQFAATGDAGIGAGSVDTTIVNAWTAQQYFALAPLTDGASIAWDLDAAQIATVTLGGNRTLSAPTHQRAGGKYTLLVKQDGTGSRTLAYNAAYVWANGITPILDVTPGAVDELEFVSDGTFMYGSLPGTFAQTQREWPSSMMWDTGTQAVAAVSALGGGVLLVPGGTAAPTLPSAFTDVLLEYNGPSTVMQVYAESGETAHLAKKLFRSQHPGSHTTTDIATVGIEFRPVGAGVNGPTVADYGLSVSGIKKDWTSTGAAYGEMDGINIVLRQGGPDASGLINRSDAGGIIINAANIGTAGSISAFESIVLNYSRALAVQTAVKTSLALIDPETGLSYGASVQPAYDGAVTYGFFATQSNVSGGTGRITYPFLYQDGTNKMWVDEAGKVTAQAFRIGANDTISQVAGIYTSINDPSGVSKMFFGNATDNTVYFRPGQTVFQDAAGAVTYASITSGGLQIGAGLAMISGVVYGGGVAGSSLVLQSTYGTGTSDSVVIKTGSGNTGLTIDTNRNVIVGSGALATSATNGFLYIESCAGTPSGTPTSATGRVPIVYDTTNNRFYAYNGAWKSVILA
jgi:microcystin-dependent protein